MYVPVSSRPSCLLLHRLKPVEAVETRSHPQSRPFRYWNIAAYDDLVLRFEHDSTTIRD